MKLVRIAYVALAGFYTIASLNVCDRDEAVCGVCSIRLHCNALVREVVTLRVFNGTSPAALLRLNLRLVFVTRVYSRKKWNHGNMPHTSSETTV